MKKKQTKSQIKIQLAQDKFVKGLHKLSETFEKETKKKVIINYTIR
jgi:hypothetical protein